MSPRSVAAELLDLVLPRPCPGCGEAGPWCPGCAAALEQRPRRIKPSEAALDAAAGLILPPLWAVARYAGAVRAAILAGKESGRLDLPPLLGVAVGRAVLRLLRWGVLAGPLWLVPAPSRRAASRRRGGDPVAAMARAAARTVAAAGVVAGVAPCLYTAGRARDSVGLDSGDRVANLAGRVRIHRAGVPPPEVAVVLLDDVVTTGATATTAIRALATVGIPTAGFLAVAAAAPWQQPR